MLKQEDLVALLLHKAQIPQSVQRIQSISNQGVTNQLSLITLQDGAHYIVRQYQWPHGETDLNRLQKEKYLHALLHQAGVSVPTILADVELTGQSAVLLEYMPGESLGNITLALSETARSQAWRSCGEMLRQAHAISYPEGTFGIIVGSRVRPFGEFFSWDDETPTWGHSQIHMILQHFHQLAKQKPDLALVSQELQETLHGSLPFLNRTAPTLLHNDAHPWNVLVRSEDAIWRCSAWLDWEYAWVGDPNWDLIRMDLFRRKPIGPTPDAFWDGYGRYPTEPERSVYAMHIFLWMANQYLNGDRHLLPTYEAAMAYIEHFDEALQRLRRLLA